LVDLSVKMITEKVMHGFSFQSAVYFATKILSV